MVPETGLEPALVTQPDPKSGASTNSATQAMRVVKYMIPDAGFFCKWFITRLFWKEVVSQASRSEER
jgi:hypothetical protein